MSINESFRWSNENAALQKKAEIIKTATTRSARSPRDDTRVLPVLLGFYAPMHWSPRTPSMNTADLIRLIIRDEAVHGHYIAKYQLSAEPGTPICDHVLLLYEFHAEQAEQYTETCTILGLTGRQELRYNATRRS